MRLISIFMLSLTYAVTFWLCTLLVFKVFGAFDLQHDPFGVEWRGISYTLLSTIGAALICSLILLFLPGKVSIADVWWAGLLMPFLFLARSLLLGNNPFLLFSIFPVHNLLSHTILFLCLPVTYLVMEKLHGSSKSNA